MDESAVRRHLADLSVVILTRNRSRYLQGVIKYWSQWPVTLILLDGSDCPVDESLLEAGEAKLVGFSAVPINERLKYAASRIDTPFACLHGDDDFTLARGAAQMIAWMKGNPEITCVASDVVLFSEDRACYVEPAGRTLISPNPKQRLLEHFSDYRFSYFYGIQRSKQLSIALSAVAAATDCAEFRKYPNAAAGYELGMEVCGAALGPLIHSPSVLLLKRVGNESRSAEKQGSNEWLEDVEAQDAVQAWQSILSHHLTPHLEVPLQTVDHWMTEALGLFCQDVKAKTALDGKTALIGKIATALRPKNNLELEFNSPNRTRLTLRVHIWTFHVLRSTFRAFMKMIGQPRTGVSKISEIDRVDPLDLQDVVLILDGTFEN